MNGIKCFGFRISLLLIFFLAFSPACKDDFNSSIPDVNFNTPVNLVNNNGLYIPANPHFFNGGYGGIVVVYTGYSYNAFDVTCPYEVSLDCRIEASDVLATCPCCGTKYNLMDGSVFTETGPGTEPLKPYRVNTSGNYLYITN